MPKFSDRTWVWLILILALVWAVMSTKWYTCGIKGFCAVPTVGKQSVSVPAPQTMPTPTPAVAEAQPERRTPCAAYLTTYVKPGASNNADSVRKVEQFLVTYEHAPLTVDGVYGPQDIAAVKAFQRKYAADILTPWGITEPSGYVYKTTLRKINAVVCAHKA